MRFLAAVLIGAALGTGAVVALVHDNGTTGPAPMRAVFQNLVPYKPPPLPATRTQFNYGSGG